MTGCSRPAVNSGSTSAAKRRLTATFSSGGRDRNIVPIHVTRFAISAPRLTVADAPPRRPTWTIEPRGRTAARLRSASSPPTTSRTTSTPSTPRACSAACSGPNQSAGERARTTSAPRSAHRCALPAEHVTAMLAPIALATWIAAVPTPEAPAWTSAQRPLVRPPCSTRASQEVMNTSGTAAASRRSRPAGTGIAWRAWVASISA